MIRISLAAILLIVGVATAHAAAFIFGQTYYYETSYKTPAATGTAYSGDSQPQVGGLCKAGSLAGCPTQSLVTADGGPLVAGTGTATTSGVISFTTPTSGLDNGQYYLMTISVDALTTGGRTGDIYELTLNGVSQGTTSVVVPNPTAPPVLAGACLSPNDATGACPFTTASEVAAQSSGAFVANAAGGETFTVGITDLLEEYVGTYDTLPGLLGYSQYNRATNCNLSSNGCGGVSSSPYGNSILQFSVSLTAAPEPTTLVLLGGAATLLGAFRRRRHIV